MKKNGRANLNSDSWQTGFGILGHVMNLKIDITDAQNLKKRLAEIS